MLRQTRFPNLKKDFSTFSGNVLHAIEKLVVEAYGPFQVLIYKLTNALFLLGSWNKDSLEFSC